MPRNVRNVWMDARVDGRDSRLSSGPVSKDGGMTVGFKLRSDGGVMDALSVITVTDDDGTIRMRVFDEQSGRMVHEITTRR
jgi:hypothetical protein